MTSDLKFEKENQDVLQQVILGIAHELNNPNTFIRVNITNLKKLFWLFRPALNEYCKAHPDTKFGPFTLPEAESKINQMFDVILGATVRIIVAADKLKQCTSDSLEQCSSISMLDVIRPVLDSHQFLFKDCTTVNFIFDQDRDYTVSGYQLQLEQAVSTLLTNAVDAIRERHGEDAASKSHLDLRLTREGKVIVLVVSDDGCGIKEESLEKVMAPYYSTKPQGVGDGLGLTICHSIVNRHGGDMEIKSEFGKGTEVSIKLPAEE